MLYRDQEYKQQLLSPFCGAADGGGSWPTHAVIVPGDQVVLDWSSFPGLANRENPSADSVDDWGIECTLSAGTGPLSKNAEHKIQAALAKQLSHHAARQINMGRVSSYGDLKCPSPLLANGLFQPFDTHPLDAGLVDG